MRDKLGRIVGVKEISDDDQRDRSFEYDKQGRLEKVTHMKDLIRQYKYDANGNRMEALNKHHSVKAAYDAQDRLLTYGKNKYQYNANGDLMQKIENSRDEKEFWQENHHDHDEDDQKIITYSYDPLGNLKSVVLPNQKKIEYIVDGQNRRIGKKINGKLVQGFVYQSQTQIAAELDGNGNLLKRFVYGSKSNVPDYMIYQNKEYRIISDQIGTPRLVVEALTGKTIQELEFDEFGVPQESEGKSLIPFGFAGGLYDADTKLTLFGARSYDAETGRWTSKDPILFEGGDTNLFSYVASDPVNGIDPTGLSRLVFNSMTGTITVISGSGQTLATFPAANNVVSTALAGSVPTGTFNYLYHTSHPESSANGPYGSNGNFVFNFPNGSGIGVHSGRSGPQSKTNGCIRSTDAATSFINNLNSTDPLSSITVEH